LESGLSEADAAARLAALGPVAKQASSRSYGSIVRANVLTVFNVILGAFGVGTGTVTGYLFALHDLDCTVMQARTVAAAVLVTVGLYLVLALEAADSRRRSTLVSGMCLSLGGLFIAAFVLPTVRRFFALSLPTLGMIATAVLASVLAIGALSLAGYTPVAGDTAATAEEQT